ncbi:ABC transporter permease [Dolosicoccus paucivorans]
MGGLVALVVAQIMPTSSSAIGTSLGIMGLLYITRGMTDISHESLSFYNPLAWSYLTYPFTKNHWTPIAFALIFSFVMGILAFILEGKRDLSASYLREKQGKAHAQASLLSIPGFTFKLNKGLILSWMSTFVILGVAYGAVYGDIGSFLNSNELVKAVFSQADVSIEVSFTTTVMMVLVCLVMILPIAMINRLYNQEKERYLSQVYSTKVKRSQMYGATTLLAVIVSILGILAVAGSLGVTAVSVMKEPVMTLTDFLKIGYNLFPSVICFVGLASVFLGWFPKVNKVVYIYLAYSFFLNYFYSLLDIPEWVLKTVPQGWLASEPLQTFEWEPFVAVFLIGLLLIGVGYYGYIKRDLIEEG